MLADAYARYDYFDDALRTIDAGLLIRLRSDDRKLPELMRLAQFGRALAMQRGDLATAARYGAALEILGSGVQFP